MNGWSINLNQEKCSCVATGDTNVVHKQFGLVKSGVDSQNVNK